MEETWKSRAEKLAEIIDDIDTASDIAKGNDIAYRAMIGKQIERSRAIVSADGSGTVVWHETSQG